MNREQLYKATLQFYPPATQYYPIEHKILLIYPKFKQIGINSPIKGPDWQQKSKF